MLLLSVAQRKGDQKILAVVVVRARGRHLADMIVVRAPAYHRKYTCTSTHAYTGFRVRYGCCASSYVAESSDVEGARDGAPSVLRMVPKSPPESTSRPARDPLHNRGIHTRRVAYREYPDGVQANTPLSLDQSCTRPTNAAIVPMTHATGKIIAPVSTQPASVSVGTAVPAWRAAST